MSEYVFYISEFIFNMVKVLMTFRLVEAASTPKCSKAVERGAVWVAAVIVSGVTVYNVTLPTNVVFSNGMMVLCSVMVWIAVRTLRKIKGIDGFSIIYLFWVMIHVLDFFVQTLMYKVFALCGVSKYILLGKNAVRAGYLLLFSGTVVLIGRWLLAEGEIFKNIKRRHLLEIVLIPAMTFLMVYFQRVYIDLMAEDYMANWTLFWLACIVAFGCGVLYTRKIRVMEANRAMQIKLHLLEENYEQATKGYKEKAELLHDEKHHVDAIREMLEKGKVEDAIRYVGEVSQKLRESGSRIWSNHLFLDLVLNMKVQEAEERLIQSEIYFDDMSGLNMQETDISVLFGNLLDNAIEAAEKIFDPERRWIKVCGERRGDMLVLNISNPTEQELQFEGELPVSTKEDKTLHGFGLQSVRHIAERYQGEMEVEENEGVFHVGLMLKGFEITVCGQKLHRLRTSAGKW